MNKKLLRKINDENEYAIPQAVVVGYGRTQTLQYKCYGCGSLYFPTDENDVICDRCIEQDRVGIIVNYDSVFYKKIVDWEQRIQASAGRTQYNFKKVMRRDNYTCQYCFYSPRYVDEFLPLHVDHIKPHVVGGNNSMKNLVVACQWCNLHLSSKVFKNFVEKQEYISEIREELGLPYSEPAWKRQKKVA